MKKALSTLLFIALSSYLARADVMNAQPWKISWVDVNYSNKWVEITLNNDSGINDRYWFSLDEAVNPYHKEMLAACMTAYLAQSLVTCVGDETQQYHFGGAEDFNLLKRITLCP